MKTIAVDALPVGSTLIDLGEGSIYAYSFSGISSLFIKGGIEFHRELSGWFKFTDISALHDKIGDVILEKGILNAQEFRFLRKEIGLTIVELCGHIDLNVNDVNLWENQNGSCPENATNILDAYRDFRRLGYVENIARLDNVKQRSAAA